MYIKGKVFYPLERRRRIFCFLCSN